jgi:hypothetical protein
MGIAGLVAKLLGGSAACLLVSGLETQAIELDGAWANQETACSQVFVKRGNKILLSKDADLYGSGFVINGNRLTGKIVSCTIASRKQDGAVIHLVTTCSTDVALQTVQFSIRPEGENKIIRIFPGIPELDTPYSRCKFEKPR